MRCKAVLRGLDRLMFHSTRGALHLGVRHHSLSGILTTPLTAGIYPMLGHVRLPFAVFGSPTPSFLTLPLTVIFPTSYQKILQFVFVVPGKVCSFVSIARFDNQSSAPLVMERAADLAVEVLILWKLQEASRGLCAAFPVASTAHCDCDGGDVMSRKRKHSEPCCGEQDIRVNELLLKYGRRSDNEECPSRAGEER